MSDYSEEAYAALAFLQEVKKLKNETDIPSESTFGYWLDTFSPAIQKTGFTSNGKSGKWCIFISAKKVDAAWIKIKQAIANDELPLAKVSTKLAVDKFKKHVICVYTLDWSDTEELEKTREVLRTLGFVRPLKYKRDIETTNKVYGGKKEYYLTM